MLIFVSDCHIAVSSSQRVAELGESDGYVAAYGRDIDCLDSHGKICTVLISNVVFFPDSFLEPQSLEENVSWSLMH